jgi:uncharacterized membrane protein YraQ (UPF0718 family)
MFTSSIAHALFSALSMAFAMGWEILWPLILGFALSGVVQAVVTKGEMSRLLPDSSPRSIVIASALGAASSSCSYAAVALARSIFRKGADFIAAMAFQFASTNLVIELGIIVAVLIGWQFVAAEFAGGLIMVALLTVMLRAVMTRPGGPHGGTCDNGHVCRRRGVHTGAHHISQGLHRDQPLFRHGLGDDLDRHRAWSVDSRCPCSLGAQGVLASLFLSADPVGSKIVGPLIGPIVAIVSFVCSVGNVPLAAVLWNGGISFGGVIAFLFADLIVPPILDIYRRYYGLKIALLLLGVSYGAMAGAAYILELVFGVAGLVPQQRSVQIVEAHLTLNYTTWLNIVFLGLAALLVWRFLKTGGPEMLRMMNQPREAHQHS